MKRFFELLLVPSLVYSDCSPYASSNKGCYLRDNSFWGGGNWVTVKCREGYILTSSGECVLPCQAGKYLYGSTCASCTDNCDECFGPHAFQCSSCSSKYALNFQRICSLTCDRSDQFGSPDKTTCTDCDPTCGSCFAEGQTACTSCPQSTTGETYSLRKFPYSTKRTNSGYCLKDPVLSSGKKNFFRQYPGDRLVIQCPPGCDKCLDRYTCTQCETGYSLYPPSDSGAQYALCRRTSR